MNHEEFRQHLTALGLSQRAFAVETGMSLSAVNEWATGRARLPVIAAAYVRLRLKHYQPGAPRHVSHATIRAWASSRETSDAIATAIFELAMAGDEQRVWESPTDIETKCVLWRAWQIDPQADALHWGIETHNKNGMTECFYRD